jgi:alkanesulfonate monooxygenase SsuD/methylene tetrahydromethanopterin reductase-like flavin-dependent oxidoreductase (luciferase family)
MPAAFAHSSRAPTGFESAWVVEQILGSIRSLEPVTLLADAAACIERLRRGSTVLLTALRSPVHLTKSLGTLDHLSGGRIDVGVGLGGNLRIYPAFGLTAARGAARFAEGIRLMKRRWTEERVTFDGTRSLTHRSGSAATIRTRCGAPWNWATHSSARGPSRPRCFSTR